MHSYYTVILTEDLQTISEPVSIAAISTDNKIIASSSVLTYDPITPTMYHYESFFFLFFFFGFLVYS
jgi:hypothetical protein